MTSGGNATHWLANDKMGDRPSRPVRVAWTTFNVAHTESIMKSERWRALPDLHLVVGTELPEAASEAA